MKNALYLCILFSLLLGCGVIIGQDKPIDGSFPEMWAKAQSLENEQKYAAALEQTTKIYEKAVAGQIQEQWIKSFIRIVLLKRGLHSAENAVRFIMEEKWPSETQHQALIHLFYANTLLNYYNTYSWEINQREKVASQKGVDLKKWAAFDIFEEIQKQYIKAYGYKEDLSKTSIKKYSEYIGYGNYPENIRPTMLDFLVYQWVEFLGNTNVWRPVELKEKYQLPFADLAAAPEKREAPVSEDFLVNPQIHPMWKLVHLLDIHYHRHMRESNPQAALETQLERIRRLNAVFNKAEERNILISTLSHILSKFELHPWWSVGQYEYARLLEQKGELVAAYQAAKAGAQRYPNSIGAQKCTYIMKSLEAPHFEINAMRFDKTNAASIEITHKNMTGLYFRAYKVDFFKWISQPHRYFGSVYTEDLRNIIHKTSPQSKWHAPLTNIPDYKNHKTYVTPQIQENGYYIVAASVREDFAASQNYITGTYMLFSNIVMTATQLENGWEVFVFNGSDGRPVPGAKVTLYRYDYNRGSVRAAELMTLADGRVFFEVRQGIGSSFVVATHKDQLTFDPNGIYFYYQGTHSTQHTGSLVYTDRSIYRPLQKLYFKVITYSGNHRSGEYKCRPASPIEVSFYDPNHKVIETVKTTTNDYGTASGEFSIPAGRVLGQYYLRSEPGSGYSYVRVEEYKRPTFEVALQKPEKSFRLNEKIVVKGDARYYFGLPVSTGKVFYRITRAPVWPWWYWWFYSSSDEGRYTYEAASGNTNLQKDGTFTMEFIPKADPSLSGQKDISYNYKVDVEVTDEGGETRTASSSYPIGFIAIRADCQMQEEYFFPQEDVSMSIVRSDLSGVPRSGEGKYRLVRLQQPKEVLTPDKFPVSLPKDSLHTQGDLVRPRWEYNKSLEQYLFIFQDGDMVKEGDTKHDNEGKSAVNLGRLEAGAYRIYYTTKDEWGSVYETRREFLVASEDFKFSLPLFLLSRKAHLKVGEKAQLFFGSGISSQPYLYEIYQSNKLIERKWMYARQNQLVEIPIVESHRGGFSIRVFGIQDYRVYELSQNIYVPWDNKHLQISFKTFRDLLRPGQKETWTVNIKGPDSQAAAAEVLSYMYDRSLDMFVPHSYPKLDSLLPSKQGLPYVRSNISYSYFHHVFNDNWFPYYYDSPLYAHRFIVFDRYPIGGLGHRYYHRGFGRMKDGMTMTKSAPAPEKKSKEISLKVADEETSAKADKEGGKSVTQPAVALPSTTDPAKPAPKAQEEQVPLRQKFHETAFFKPHLVTDANGDVQIEFEVPDSVTSWNVYVHAMTKDLKFMSHQQKVVTVKDLMVRPYVPRFFREGDEGILKVVINNATQNVLEGDVSLVILDPETNQDKTAEFAITAALKQTWKAAGKESANVSWEMKAPHHLKTYAFKVIARTKDFSDGELRPFPILPSRMHLVQSKFVTLKDKDSRTLYLQDLEKAGEDPTLIHQSLVVNLDAQLIYTALKSLPYLVDYPYECVEQTLNRFLSTGIVTSLYKQYPPIAKMAKEFSDRKTMLDPWKKDDPNRKMSLEETPWLVAAEGGYNDMSKMINVLDEKIATAQRESALQKLKEAQISNGAFPWWAGGPPSPYMTLYLLYGFSKAQEFNVAVPKPMVQNAWRYMASHFRDYYAGRMIKENFGYHFIAFLNYVLSCYKDPTYYEGSFTEKERKDMLEYCFQNWKKLCPYLKAYLALTLMRMDRPADARLVMESIMDSAITKEDQGTFWAPEDRGWLWYNDNIESHAFVLRALQEVMPDNKKQIDGLVLWILLNKKMNQWKSTRTTAEVVYSLCYTMKKQGALGVREVADVTIGDRKQQFVFEPDKYTGDKNRIVLDAKEIEPKSMAKVVVEKSTPGYMFASMTWHYSTEKMPEEARGDFLAVTRQFYLRKHEGQEYVLRPIAEGTQIQVGDQVEVHLSIRSKHPMEYVHLRDPRGAGFEPEKATSGHRWDLGIYWYEEIRDSATNFFFEHLPQGEYNFKYRIRASMAGKFRVGPAVIQNMYAPEFAAFSSGTVISIR